MKKIFRDGIYLFIIGGRLDSSVNGRVDYPRPVLERVISK